ncbi:hypothetical protein DNTS_023530 [Danionella cerebrum]|uniref:PID domain-containing protein n=1 Tax=Danionella cerebrum TaxID=2873325 RepID=A0A553R7B6_9TELE|nr:hypothetical protein DNTS_023530 [Danionella translucida]
MVFCQAMDPREDGDGWMEEQWEKWLTQDISLNEYEDDDLSEVTEITDENGITLDQLELDPRDHMTQPTNGTPRSGRRRGVVELQAEMLHLDLIDAEGGIQEEEGKGEGDKKCLFDAVHDNRREEQGAGLPVSQPQLKDIFPDVTMDTYRPKRPTTLNLFPQVPRTQDTINNNSFGEKERRKEKKTHSSSPHIKGDPVAKPEQVTHTDGDKVHARADTKPQAPASSNNKVSAFQNKTEEELLESSNNPSVVAPLTQNAMRDKCKEVSLIEGVLDRPNVCKEKAHYHTVNGYREQVQYPEENEGTRNQSINKTKDYHISERNATQEIHLTPVNGEQERPLLSQSSDSNRMSISSDTELPPLHYYPSAGCPNPSISEEDEVYPPTPPCRTVSLSEPGESWMQSRKPKVTKEDAGNVKTVAVSTDASGLTYDSVKYTLVVDEHAKLELVSIKDCYKGYESDSDNTVYESAIDEDEEDQDADEEEEEESGARSMMRDTSGLSADSTTDTTSDVPCSRKFKNVFVSGRSRFSGAEFGYFSCVINGEEREQSHRAVFRFIPRHDDELELEADDPLLVEVQAEDLWCEAYNMRTGSKGVFPAFYAVKIAKDEMIKEVKGEWKDKFWVKFLGSVQVPYHKGNDVLCAAMHKIATNRRTTMQFNSPSPCIVEINCRGVKIVVQDDCRSSGRGEKCFHFFQLKNISFCGCHPKNNKYFGLITKHPANQRFACHVFFSDDTTTKLAESVGKAFQHFYKEHMEYSCPTEDIFLE